MSSKTDIMDQIDDLFSPDTKGASKPEKMESDNINKHFGDDSDDSQCTENLETFQTFRNQDARNSEYTGYGEEINISNISYTTPSIETSKMIKKWKQTYHINEKEYNIHVRKGRFIIESDYDKDWVHRFRVIQGKEFDWDTKEWSFPLSSLKKFMELFPEFELPKEIVYEYKMMMDPINNLIEVPDMDKFNGVLYPFQKSGVSFLITGKKVLLCDEMGLGKTVEGIAASTVLLESGIVDKVMVFCPSALKYQWEKEISKFTGRSSIRIAGTPKQREKLWAHIRNKDFIIINYEKAINKLDNKNIIHALQRWDFVLILDEATRIKNWRSKTTKAFNEFKAPVKFLLTGTPIENHPAELYTLSNFLDTNIMGSWSKFNERYIYRNEQGWILGYKNLEELHGRIQPLMLRRKKNEVLPELPDKIITEYFVDTTDVEKRDYKAIKNIIMKYLERTEEAKESGDKSDFDINQRALFHSIQFCKMYCDHPDLVRDSKSELIKGLELKSKTSSKLEELKYLVEEIVTNGNKVVIFTEFVRSAKLIKKEIPGVIVYRGGLSEKEKNNRIYQFLKDPECMILCSTDAGSHGLNLQEASFYLINFDLPWNPSVLNQRIDRVHRIGQSNTVNIINMIIRDDDMIEKEVRRVLKRKQLMFDKVIDGR